MSKGDKTKVESIVTSATIDSTIINDGEAKVDVVTETTEKTEDTIETSIADENSNIEDNAETTEDSGIEKTEGEIDSEQSEIIEAIEIPKGMVSIIGLKGRLRDKEYYVTSELATTLIKKGSAELKKFENV